MERCVSYLPLSLFSHLKRPPESLFPTPLLNAPDTLHCCRCPPTLLVLINSVPSSSPLHCASDPPPFTWNWKTKPSPESINQGWRGPSFIDHPALHQSWNLIARGRWCKCCPHLRTLTGCVKISFVLRHFAGTFVSLEKIHWRLIVFWHLKDKKIKKCHSLDTKYPNPSPNLRRKKGGQS